MHRLNGKVALVTGAARGIGAAIAKAFATQGAFVLVTDIDEAGAAAQAEQLGACAAHTRLDVREEADWIAAIDNLLAARGKLDVLVNNAGITGFEAGMVAHDPENAALADWRAVHAVNLDGVFLGCKHAIRAMRPAGTGSIVNIASRSGMVGVPGAAAYASAKAAVRNHTKSVALHCAGQGLEIRCNAILPAAIMTPMWEAVLGSGPDRPAREAAALADCPMKRFGRPEEVAALAVMLASDEATYMTGAELVLDGGILAGGATPAPAES
ncbi:glucose 1-dehydrogenase [Salinarimonas ramus]|uniref:Short-chain dehydrogenase n=1 Tax=Salinarimonas ramus TaxID=690164 RepID=A0A917V307_9HYPH|nr:glucose 1-dehydrogenase [Salinarimonas ramus]GGK28030.1 short-chain dehydrogenase [Salinarimonas ramus]